MDFCFQEIGLVVLSTFQFLQLFFVSQTGGLLGTQEFAPLNAGVCQLGDRWLLFV